MRTIYHIIDDLSQATVPFSLLSRCSFDRPALNLQDFCVSERSLADNLL
jgi:hypothetical protein